MTHNPQVQKILGKGADYFARQALFSALLVAGTVAVFQAPQAGAQQLEEIIVTAQRREERMQDVPLAVTAMSERDLEIRGIQGVSGLATGAVPSINAQTFAGRPGVMQLSIRGVGGSDPAQVSFEQGVAIYADGVYMARGQGLGLDIMDLERMEVLRGPQGTLFGRNAVGGAVNLVPRKPSGEFSFRQVIDYGRFDSLRAHTTVESKAWNNLSLKADYQRSQRDGWQSNPAPGQEDMYGSEQDSVRLAARWQPTDQFTADYVYDKTALDYVQGYNHIIVNSAVPIFATIMAPYVHDSRQSRVPAPGLWAPESTNDISGHALTMEWSLSDEVSVKSITAYRDNEVDTKALNGFGILAPSTGGFLGGNSSAELMEQDQFSQEFQLFGSRDRLQYTLGAMYFEESAETTNFSRFTLFVPFSTLRPELINPVETPRTTTELELKSIGVYGQVTWTPPVLEDRLDITLGLRYSKDEKDLFRSLLNNNPVAIPISANDERVDPALTFGYKLADDVSIYARWQTAYRGGGASMRELPDSRDPTDSGFNPFDSEEVEVYEVGLKSEFWDRRARFNMALFHQTYSDKQVSFQKDTVANTRVFNIGDDVTLKGTDLELVVMATERLSLNMSATWMMNNITRVANPSTGLVEPFRMAQMPKLRWAASADYQFPVQPFGGDMSLFVSLTGSSDYCFNERSCFGRFEELRGGSGKTSGDDNTLLDARLTLAEIAAGSGNLKFALWGKNLTDEEYYSFGFSVPGINSGIINYGDPRTYGLSVTYEYR